MGTEKVRSADCWNSWFKPVGSTKANPCNKIPRGDDDECRSSEVIDTMLPGKATKR